MKKRLILALVVAFSFPTIAAAKPDGKTLEQELKSNSNRFTKVDTDSNGKINQAELLVENTRIAERDKKPVSKGKSGTFGSNNDSDGDGAVSLAESEVFVRAQFEKRDVDKDGIVTEAEKEAAKKN